MKVSRYFLYAASACMTLGSSSCYGVKVYNTTKETLIVKGVDQDQESFVLEIAPLAAVFLPELGNNELMYHSKDTAWQQYVVNPISSLLSAVGFKKAESWTNTDTITSLVVDTVEPTKEIYSLEYIDTPQGGRQLVSLGDQTAKAVAIKLVQVLLMRKRSQSRANGS